MIILDIFTIQACLDIWIFASWHGKWQDGCLLFAHLATTG
jgi:hypothetical protein